MALDLWLQFPEANNPQIFDLRQPFGKTSQATPPGWWGWTTSYDSHLLSQFSEMPRLGSTEVEGWFDSPNWLEFRRSNWAWAWNEPWSAAREVESTRPRERISRGHMAPRRVWEEFQLTEDSWGQVFPDVHALNPEIWDAHVTPLPMGWLSPLRSRSAGQAPASGTTTTVDLVESAKESTVTETRYNVSGFGWCDLGYGSGYPWPMQETESLPQTREVTETYGVWPGFRYGQEWGDAAWYLSWSERAWLEQVETEPVDICSIGGLVATTQVRTESRLVPGTPPTPASQILRPVAEATAFSFTAESPSVAPPLILEEVNLGNLSLDLDLTPVDATSLQSFNVFYQVSGYRLEPPVKIATYDTPYSAPWLSGGSPGTSGRIQELPIYEDIAICGVFSSWAQAAISAYEVKINVDDNSSLTDTYPLLKKVLIADNWQCFLETKEVLYLIKPSTIIWANPEGKRSGQFSPGEGFETLLMEFLIHPDTDLSLRSVSLRLGSELIHYDDFYYPLDARKAGAYGFKFEILFKVPDSSKGRLVVDYSGNPVMGYKGQILEGYQ